MSVLLLLGLEEVLLLLARNCELVAFQLNGSVQLQFDFALRLLPLYLLLTRFLIEVDELGIRQQHHLPFLVVA